MSCRQRQPGWIRAGRILARVGAVIYSALSTFPLVFLLAVSRGRVTERATVLSTTKYDGREFDGFGLTYNGLSGTALLWAQLLIVLVAVLVSCRRGVVGVSARGVLCAWALFLIANTAWVVLGGGYTQMAWLIAVAAVGGLLTGADLTFGISRLRASPTR